MGEKQQENSLLSVAFLFKNISSACQNKPADKNLLVVADVGFVRHFRKTIKPAVLAECIRLIQGVTLAAVRGVKDLPGGEGT